MVLSLAYLEFSKYSFFICISVIESIKDGKHKKNICGGLQGVWKKAQTRKMIVDSHKMSEW